MTTKKRVKRAVQRWVLWNPRTCSVAFCSKGLPYVVKAAAEKRAKKLGRNWVLVTYDWLVV